MERSPIVGQMQSERLRYHVAMILDNIVELDRGALSEEHLVQHLVASPAETAAARRQIYKIYVIYFMQKC